ncbi:Sir2 family NAD-dependent protein deacetylase [Desulfosarcina cetonica]|uniref:SIR2 family NAD-dependent protein deacylase n=1 Tax=Desulfosarcina cetonica TaxID=90730 RepID=UPI001FEE25FE
MSDSFENAVNVLTQAKKAVALTGAGISVESGIPPFRGKGGLWEKIDPMKYAHIDAFLEDPKTVWDVDQKHENGSGQGTSQCRAHRTRRSRAAGNPPDGHHPKRGWVAPAGRQPGCDRIPRQFRRMHCQSCDWAIETAQVDLSEIPPRCGCGGFLRPDCIFFGELIPHEALFRSQQVSAACDVMLVIGTSATVQPAASMPFIARDNGAVVIEINPEPTSLTQRISHLPLMGAAGTILPRLVGTIRQRLATP